MQNLNVTFIQTSLYWENIDENLAMFSEKINAVNQKTDLIILPEMFSTGFTMNPEQFAEPLNGKALLWMKKIAAEKNCVLCGSISCEDNGKYYNRLIWMKPNGEYEKYDKRHLFRYGNEHHHYAAGNKKIIVELNGWKICPLICYDLRFPVWSRNQKQEYDLLLYIANWPERRNTAWKTLLSARAIENQSYVIGVNRVGSDGKGIEHSGDSAVINFKGDIISKTKAHEINTETIVLDKSALEQWRKDFPAWADADDFKIVE